MKNLLAMVQAIVQQSLRGANDIEAAKDVLADRLITLGKAHDLLLGGAAERAKIAAVIRDGVGLHDASGRISYTGEDIEIGGRASLSLALMIHELTTNAVKYGALSNPDGQVAVTWSVSNTAIRRCASLGRSGGARLSAHQHEGFRLTPDRARLDRGCRGKLSLTYPVAGVLCEVEAPLRNFQLAL